MMSALGPHDGYLLCLFGAHVDQAFGHPPYHVGSSLTEKRRYRDVDVRLMLPDDEFVAYFGSPTQAGWLANRKSMWELVWTTFGRKLTRLPVDFQIQDTTLANEEFNGPRSALLLLDSHLPFVRTNPET